MSISTIVKVTKVVVSLLHLVLDSTKYISMNWLIHLNNNCWLQGWKGCGHYHIFVPIQLSLKLASTYSLIWWFQFLLKSNNNLFSEISPSHNQLKHKTFVKIIYNFWAHNVSRMFIYRSNCQTKPSNKPIVNIKQYI